jgi:hypothetical protein
LSASRPSRPNSSTTCSSSTDSKTYLRSRVES